MRKATTNTTAGCKARNPWLIVALLFVVALINYFDRQSLSIVVPRFQAELHLSTREYGHVVSLFLMASAFAYALSGFITDFLGTRTSMALFVGWWSIAEAMTAFATSALQLGVVRFCLGLGEPGLWVAAPKAIGEILAKRQRSLGIGIYTLGATVGAVVAVPAIAIITSRLPWRWIFLIDGAAGLLWLPFWIISYRRSPGLERSSADLQVSDARSGLREVVCQTKIWSLMIARGMTDPVWYFYLFWFPMYLLKVRHLSLEQLEHVGWIVYCAAGAGTMLGGLFSGWLIRRGVAPCLSYRRVMLSSALLVPLSPLAALVPSTLLAISIAAVVALAHMAWLVNLTSAIIELFPAGQVGTAAGLVAAGSGLGGMVSSEIIAYCVVHGGYTPVFFIMAVMHPIALLVLWKTLGPYFEAKSSVRKHQPGRRERKSPDGFDELRVSPGHVSLKGQSDASKSLVRR